MSQHRRQSWNYVLAGVSGAAVGALAVELGRSRHAPVEHHRSESPAPEPNEPEAKPSAEPSLPSNWDRRYEFIYNQAAVGIERVSLRDGQLLEVNASLCEMLGYPCAELLTRTFEQITHPADRGREQELLDRLLRREIPSYVIEKRYLKHDGTPLWVRVTSSLAVWNGPEEFRISIIEDISEQKRAQEEYRQSQELYKLVVDHAQDFALITFDVEGALTSWNLGAERVYGWKEQEAIGQSVAIIFTPEDRELGFHREEMRLARETGYASDERWHIRKDGVRFYFSGSVWPMYEENHALRGFAKVGTDVTGRKRLEEELNRHRSELEQTVERRTAALTESVHQLEAFSYSLSHDLRAPLRHIRSYVEIVNQDCGASLPTQYRELLSRCAESTRRMDHMIQDVLTYYRTSREPAQMHPVDTQSLVEQIAGERAAFDPARIDLIVHSPLQRVIGHEMLLTQCLTNLLGNAARFMPAGRRPRIVVRTERRENQVRIWVEDNGIGIPRQSQERIWEMFRTLNSEQYDGTGIGLAIVRKAVERMGGTAGVESEPDRGSKFWVQLPAA